MKNTAKKTLALLLTLVMVIGLMPGMTAWAEGTPKTIAAGESYYIGDSISFSEPYPWVRYDDDSSANYVGRLVASENTTVPTPTYDSRCSQWKFTNVWKYDMDGWTSNTLRITGSNAQTPIGFKCSGGTGAQNDPFTFEAIYPAAHTHSFTYSAEGDTITATCGNDGCDLTDNKVTLTIGDPANPYYNDNSSTHAFTLEGLEAFNSATGKTISVNDIVYYKGDNQSSDIKNERVKLATYKAKLTVEGKTAEHSFTFTAKPVAHTHSFSYAASGNVITATCNGAGTCDLANKQATLTLNAPAHTAYGDGKDANATFTGEIPGVTNPTINYRKSDTPLSAAPTEAGTYTAWCQLGSATARVEYTIAKAAAAYTTEPQAKTLHYTGQPQELVTAGTATGGTILYTAIYASDREPDEMQGDRPYTESIPEMTNPGTYYVWYKLEGGKNYNGLAAKQVAVTIGDPEASINFLGGSLRRRVYRGTDTVIDFETDLRFGFNFELPAGAEVDKNKSYFSWKEGAEATAETGKRIAIKNVGNENGKLVANMVITGVPKAAYQGDINCFVHLVYTLDDMEFVMEANKDSNGDAYTRSVKQVCDGLVSDSQWGAYAQSLLDAIS